MTITTAGLIVTVVGTGVIIAAGIAVKKAAEMYGKMCFKRGAMAARINDNLESDMAVDPETGEDIKCTVEDLDEEARAIAKEQLKSVVMIYGSIFGFAAFIGKCAGTISRLSSKVTELENTIRRLGAKLNLVII